MIIVLTIYHHALCALIGARTSPTDGNKQHPARFYRFMNDGAKTVILSRHQSS